MPRDRRRHAPAVSLLLLEELGVSAGATIGTACGRRLDRQRVTMSWPTCGDCLRVLAPIYEEKAAALDRIADGFYGDVPGRDQARRGAFEARFFACRYAALVALPFEDRPGARERWAAAGARRLIDAVFGGRCAP